ncbi:hypothetical protein F443_03697 [Phytophthora nicotianae P1569]|uniref:Uncharacterized protein n=1 Tax=Phytophthora nicotianae P1569 TaxID=1317065 RepID=V9FRB5_PHYNI|nr:hypothetical protein F443_03697 [Phytophthora nicotianae P1569]
MPSHFDKHWWIQQGPEQEHIAAARILHPLPARANGCRKPREITHKRNHGANGTARELVHFEHVEINDTNLTASQPTQPDPSLFGTQTLDKVHESGQQNSAAATVLYHHHHTPARSWGYAGMSPYK